MSNTTTSSTTQQQVGTAGQAGSLIGSLAPIGLMLLVFYFLIMRPQQKREAKRRELIKSLKRGDKIVTASGIIGTVHKVVNESEITMEVAEGVRIHVLKNAVTEVLNKSSETPEEVDNKNVDEESAEEKGTGTKKVKSAIVAKKKTSTAKDKAKQGESK